MDKIYIKLKEKLKNLGYLPRWIIVIIDLIIIALTIVITNFLFLNIKLIPFDVLNFYQLNASILIVNLFFFFLFKTYSGIIRHSSFFDGIKLLLATFSTFVTLAVINYSYYYVYDSKIFLFPGLLLRFFLSFTFLFLFRIAVKFIFENFIYNSDTNNLIPAIVFGSDANAIAVANAIKVEVPARFKIVGFVNKSKSSKSKNILGLPLFYTNKNVSVILRKLKSSTLIIAEKTLSKEEKLNIIDDCLENNIKIFTVPLVVNWDNEKEISKQIKSFEIDDLLERKPIVLDNNLISKQLTGKTILISGAAGSIGSEIVWQVLDFKPKKIILIDQAETPLHHLTLEIQKSRINVKVLPIISDIRDKKSIEKVFEKYNPNIVFHAAAYKHVPLMEINPTQAICTNILGTKNMADLSVQYGIKKFVMVSTDKAVNPSNIMGASKRIAEKYVQALHNQNIEHKTNLTAFITTRFGNVLGSNGSVVPLFKKQIENGGPITITHSEIIRYFMTIPEACQLVLEAGAIGNGGEIYLFDMGKPVKIIDLAKKMIKLAGFVPYEDIDIKIIGLRPGEKLYEELLNDNSKTLPTHHDKIMIAVEEKEDYNEVLQSIEVLLSNYSNQNDLIMVKQMKIIVPEFKSLNSVFEALD